MSFQEIEIKDMPIDTVITGIVGILTTNIEIAGDYCIKEKYKPYGGIRKDIVDVAATLGANVDLEDVSDYLENNKRVRPRVIPAVLRVDALNIVEERSGKPYTLTAYSCLTNPATRRLLLDDIRLNLKVLASEQPELNEVDKGKIERKYRLHKDDYYSSKRSVLNRLRTFLTH